MSTKQPIFLVLIAVGVCMCCVSSSATGFALSKGWFNAQASSTGTVANDTKTGNAASTGTGAGTGSGIAAGTGGTGPVSCPSDTVGPLVAVRCPTTGKVYVINGGVKRQWNPEDFNLVKAQMTVTDVDCNALAACSNGAMVGLVHV